MGDGLLFDYVLGYVRVEKGVIVFFLLCNGMLIIYLEVEEYGRGFVVWWK